MIPPDNEAAPPASRLAVCFSVGFRPFFLGASLVAISSMLIWMLVLIFGWQPQWSVLSKLPALHWHAHEMIYGYAVAVIAGFLLTAVQNWTHLPTAENKSLLILFSSWATARILMLIGPLEFAAIFDIAFMLQLVYYIVKPIIKVKLWRQLLVVLILTSLLVGNVLFYLGALGILNSGVRLGIYFGLYLVSGMILLIGQRIIPSFISSGIGENVTFPKLLVISVGLVATYIAFLVNEVFLHFSILGIASSSALFFFSAVRLISWHHRAIWKKPLLWSLYLSYASLSAGFLLYTLSYLNLLSPYVALHLLAMGGIALVTLSMMSRVSLGHTGRNIHSPPPLLALSFTLLCIAILFRVAGPIIIPGSYLTVILISQICWIAAFSLFAFMFVPILIKPRLNPD